MSPAQKIAPYRWGSIRGRVVVKGFQALRGFWGTVAAAAIAGARRAYQSAPIMNEKTMNMKLGKISDAILVTLPFIICAFILFIARLPRGLFQVLILSVYLC